MKKTKIIVISILSVFAAVFVWWLVQHQMFFARTWCGKRSIEDQNFDYQSCVRRELFVWHPIWNLNQKAYSFVSYDDTMISFKHDPEFAVNYFGTTPRDNNWNIENKENGTDGYISVQQGKEALLEGKQLIDITPLGKQYFGDNVFDVYYDPLAKTKTFQEYIDGYTVTFAMQNGGNLDLVPFVDLSSIQINTAALSAKTETVS